MSWKISPRCHPMTPFSCRCSEPWVADYALCPQYCELSAPFDAGAAGFKALASRPRKPHRIIVTTHLPPMASRWDSGEPSSCVSTLSPRMPGRAGHLKIGPASYVISWPRANERPVQTLSIRVVRPPTCSTHRLTHKSWEGACFQDLSRLILCKVTCPP